MWANVHLFESLPVSNLHPSPLLWHRSVTTVFQTILSWAFFMSVRRSVSTYVLGVLFFLSVWVPCLDLPGDSWCWFQEWVTNPHRSFLSDLISSIPLVCFLRQVTVTDGVWPTNMEDSTAFTLRINSGIFVCNDRTLEFQMFFSCINAPLDLPILGLTFASVPPCLSMTQPRYVKDSTLSI